MAIDVDVVEAVPHDEDAFLFRPVTHDRQGNPVTRVMDATHVLPGLFHTGGDRTPRCFAWIEPYGATLFNQHQMGYLLPEWRKLYELAATPEQRDFLSQAERLMTVCQGHPDFFLRFAGD